jgi:hypothetical protein
MQNIVASTAAEEPRIASSFAKFCCRRLTRNRHELIFSAERKMHPQSETSCTGIVPCEKGWDDGQQASDLRTASGACTVFGPASRVCHSNSKAESMPDVRGGHAHGYTPGCAIGRADAFIRTKEEFTNPTTPSSEKLYGSQLKHDGTASLDHFPVVAESVARSFRTQKKQRQNPVKATPVFVGAAGQSPLSAMPTYGGFSSCGCAVLQK